MLDQERLYNDLLRDVPSNVHVVLLPKSGGVVERSKKLRHESREQRIKEYFYGNLRTPYYPFSFEVKFQDLRLYKIGAPPLPDSCMPIGMKAEDNKKKVVAVTPTQALLHHVLTLSFAESVDDVIATNIAGFCCVYANLMFLLVNVDIFNMYKLFLAPTSIWSVSQLCCYPRNLVLCPQMLCSYGRNYNLWTTMPSGSFNYR